MTAREWIECVPNISEGRRSEVVAAVVAAVTAVAGVRLLDVHSDAGHNRSVLTYVVPPDAAVEAGLAVARAALEHIDLRTHSGVHPRIGALDVFPFVPLGEVSMERCVELAHALGTRIAADFDVPVYYYGEAALHEARRPLERVRGKGFEDLREGIAHDPARLPDAGPPQVHPSAGATAVGARAVLIAFNVYLATADVRLAQRVARRLRASSGGLRGVKALGLDPHAHDTTGSQGERAETQVSMNLTDYQHSSIVAVMDLIRAEATRHGVAVTRSEIVGLLPLGALLDAAGAFLQLDTLTAGSILERHLWHNAGG